MQREGRSQSPHRNYCSLNQIPRCWYERIHYALQKYYILGRNENIFVENQKNLATFVVQKSFYI